MIKFRLRTAPDGNITINSGHKTVAFCTPDEDGATLDGVFSLFKGGGEIILTISQFEDSEFDRITKEVRKKQKQIEEEIWASSNHKEEKTTEGQ